MNKYNLSYYLQLVSKITVNMNAKEKASIIQEAIKNRRSYRKFLSKKIPSDLLKIILDSAKWAPNHRKTEPWRFISISKSSNKRIHISDAVKHLSIESSKNPNPKSKLKSAEKSKREILDSPELIYAFSIPGDTEEITQENYAATCISIQNMALTSYFYNISISWSTGKATKIPCLDKILEIPAEWKIVGTLFMGFPAKPMNQIKVSREDFSYYTIWHD